MVRKIAFAFIALCALVCAPSCSKKTDTVPEKKVDYPSWIDNESEQVPIQFGMGTIVSTKSDGSIEDPGLFRHPDFRYGVLAVDNFGKAHPAVTGVPARNEESTLWEDGREGMLKTVFVDGSGERVYYHYPPYSGSGSSERGYTFYGYRTDNTNTGFTAEPTEGGGFVKSGIQMGPADIIWAKAAAIGNPAGYNGAYIRRLIAASVPEGATGDYHFYLFNNLAPHFNFEHLTSRFKFVVRAESSYAAATMDGLVRITAIRLENVTTKATLDILNGTLSADTSTSGGTVNVNRDQTTPFYPKNDDIVWGDSVFLLPSALDDAAASDGIKMYITINTDEFGDQEYSTTLKYDGRTDTFEAGKSYRFIVSLKSYESISISATVDDWTDVDASGSSPYIIG